MFYVHSPSPLSFLKNWTFILFSVDMPMYTLGCFIQEKMIIVCFIVMCFYTEMFRSTWLAKCFHSEKICWLGKGFGCKREYKSAPLQVCGFIPILSRNF